MSLAIIVYEVEVEKSKNLFIAPHISWAPKETRKRLMNLAVSNLKSYQEGKPVNVVS